MQTYRDSIGRTFAALGAAVLLALGTAAPGAAQGMDDSKWSVDGRAGVTVPTGDLADLNVSDVGPAGGLGIGYEVHPRVTITADGAFELLPGDSPAGGSDSSPAGDALAPDLRLYHYNAGVEVELTPPETGRFDVTANVAGGATTWDTDEFTANGTRAELSETYLTANGGLEAGYRVSRSVNAFVGGQWYMQFTDEAETAPLAQTADLGEGFDTASTIPVYAGLELSF